MKLARYHNSPVTNPLSGLDALLGFPSTGLSPLWDIATRLSNVPWDRVVMGQGAPSLFEDDENYYARFEFPGVKKEGVAVELTGNQLAITVERGEDNVESRSVTVPEGVDPEKVGAKLADGILTVTLGKLEAQKPRVIKVK